MSPLPPLRKFVLAAAFLILLLPPTLVFTEGFETTTTRFRFLFAGQYTVAEIGSVNVPILAWIGFLLALLWLAAAPPPSKP